MMCCATHQHVKLFGKYSTSNLEKEDNFMNTGIPIFQLELLGWALPLSSQVLSIVWDVLFVGWNKCSEREWAGFGWGYCQRSLSAWLRKALELLQPCICGCSVEAHKFVELDQWWQNIRLYDVILDLPVPQRSRFHLNQWILYSILKPLFGLSSMSPKGAELVLCCRHGSILLIENC